MMRAPESDRQAGMTLTELLVSMIVLVVIMIAAGTLMISIMTNEGISRANASAGNEAQVAFKQVEYDLRNAVSATTARDGHVLIVATRQAVTANTQKTLCVTYLYDDASGKLKRFQSTDNTVSHAVYTASSLANIKSQAASWPVSGTNVVAVGGAHVFGPSDRTVKAPEAVQVQLGFVTTSNRKPITFLKAISLRTQSDLVNTCN
jgi:prepilin-type N-terminal cleavage/methylation domain-containing protein